MLRVGGMVESPTGPAWGLAGEHVRQEGLQIILWASDKDMWKSVKTSTFTYTVSQSLSWKKET